MMAEGGESRGDGRHEGREGEGELEDTLRMESSPFLG